MAAHMGNGMHCAVARKLPVVVILGATGTGKSKLAVDICLKYSGEVISADSMQVYKGLDIVTNKVTPEERKMVPHHMLDFVESLSRYTVVDFRNQALPIINNLLVKGKMPVIVGGTNYYIESLLWDVLIKPEDSSSDVLVFDREKCIGELDIKTNSYKGEGTEVHTEGRCMLEHLEPNSTDEESTPESSSSDQQDEIIEQSKESLSSTDVLRILQKPLTASRLSKISNENLHELLSLVDSSMATRLHPHDRRKVIRSLQVYQQQGRPHSQVLQEQHSLEGGNSLGGPLRFSNTCIFWLQCDQQVLNDRLKKRIDGMMERGLIEELTAFHQAYNHHRLSQNLEADYTQGIFQSIGFKEFHKYLILSSEERETAEGKKLLLEGVEAMKTRTCQYSKKQTRWIQNRFLQSPGRQVPPLYSLDTTVLHRWQELVYEPAINILEAVIQVNF
ncbi:tRNA dimethylallyltransferase-like [Tachypleus tridentatus]|uniref:tRNA dimethylallyltransferase-like n=1 Tax=Tachypleus tridentatus TaxID=6853 RepID=UPI003FCEEBA7